MNYKDTTARIFNKFFSGFLKDLKEIDDTLKAKVKSAFKVIDKASHEYCQFYVENVLSSFDVLKSGVLQEMHTNLVCQGITIGDILENLTEEQKVKVYSYIYMLALFAYMYTLDDEKPLLDQVIRLVSSIQNNGDDYEKEKDDIIDDDIKCILGHIHTYGGKSTVQLEGATTASASTTGAGEGFDPTKLLESMNNSKIANLAKEISKDIDLSGINTDNPEEAIKNMFDFSGNNNMLGNIIQKVSTTLNDKISSGEFKHEDLISEAMSMMNMFGGPGGGANNPFAGNPLFNQIMKNMKSGKASVKQDVVKKGEARDRLRKKLEMRKKNVD